MEPIAKEATVADNDKALEAMAKVFGEYGWLADLSPTDKGLQDELGAALGNVTLLGLLNAAAISQFTHGLEALDWAVNDKPEIKCEHCGHVESGESPIVRAALTAYVDNDGTLEGL